MKELAFTILGLSILLGSANGTLAMTAEEVEAAEFSVEDLGEGPDPLVVRLQILLDRHGASPGVIDGYPGENVEEALRAFETMKGLEADGVLDETAWDALVETGGSVTRPMRSWRTTFPDWSRRSRRTFPKWRNGRVGYTSVQEKLAERFHMDVDFLKELNPDADFSKAGTKIVVADTGKDAQGEVGRVEVTKEPGRLFAYAADGGLVCRLPRYRGQRAAPLALGTPRGKAIALDVT